MASAAIGEAYVVVAVGSFCTRRGGNCTHAVHLDAQGQRVGAPHTTSDGNQWHTIEGSAATDSALYVAQGARFPPVPIYRYTPTPTGVDATVVMEHTLECTGGVGFAALMARGSRFVGVTQGELNCAARVGLVDAAGQRVPAGLPPGTVVERVFWADDDTLLLLHHRDNDMGERISATFYAQLRTDGTLVARGRLRAGVDALPVALAERRGGTLEYGANVSFALADVLGVTRTTPLVLGRGRAVPGSGVPGVTLERAPSEHWVFFADRGERRRWTPTWVRVQCGAAPPSNDESASEGAAGRLTRADGGRPAGRPP